MKQGLLYVATHPSTSENMPISVLFEMYCQLMRDCVDMPETMGVYLSLIETRKSLGVDEKSSKLAMSSCLT